MQTFTMTVWQIETWMIYNLLYVGCNIICVLLGNKALGNEHKTVIVIILFIIGVHGLSS